MTKFEYLVKDIHGLRLAADKLEQQLDALGLDGWELVSTFDRTNGFRCFVFKRETQAHIAMKAIPAA